VPTARELLEQADALMRRNRSAIVDDIPVLTDSVPLPSEARVLRGRAPAPRLPVPQSPGDPIPTLTERVVPGADAPAGTVIEEGEPSDWLQLGAGEPSVIGDAPDSIAIVPPVPKESPVEPEPLLAVDAEEIEFSSPAEADQAFDDELAERVPPPVTTAPPTAAELASAFAATHAPEVTEPVIEDEPAFDDDREPDTFAEFEREIMAAPAAHEEAPSEPEDDISLAEVENAAPAEVELAAPAEVELAPPVEVELAAPAKVEIVAPAEVEVVVPVEAPSVPVEVPAPSAATPPKAVPETLDEAILGAAPEIALAQAASARAEQVRWASMAEEIRMQVLQRIDLFTDTGLREQLGARLQPIVDRASADLVATINLHVGELLRAYVAEAIEREIESWRKENV